MAPEVYRAEKYCPKAADVYSLGVVLFMLLTGIPPYTVPDPSDQRFQMLANGSHQGVKALLNACKSPGSGEIPSKEVIDMLSYMLCPSSKRYTLKEILSHPFLRVKDPNSPKLKFSNFIIKDLQEEGKSSPCNDAETASAAS